MVVRVKLFATLRRYRPELGIGEAMPITLPEGTTLEELIEQLQLPAGHIRVVFVNGIVCAGDHVLQDGDEVGIFPPVGGG